MSHGIRQALAFSLLVAAAAGLHLLAAPLGLSVPKAIPRPWERPPRDPDVVGGYDLLAELPDDCRARGPGDTARVKRAQEWVEKRIEGKRYEEEVRLQEPHNYADYEPPEGGREIVLYPEVPKPWNARGQVGLTYRGRPMWDFGLHLHPVDDETMDKIMELPGRAFTIRARIAKVEADSGDFELKLADLEIPGIWPPKAKAKPAEAHRGSKVEGED